MKESLTNKPITVFPGNFLKLKDADRYYLIAQVSHLDFRLVNIQTGNRFNEVNIGKDRKRNGAIILSQYILDNFYIVNKAEVIEYLRRVYAM